mgnify:CR=1 FL=1|tara:strand:+ start:669 stop:1169 length:501 start_codon:yes stop_codon:yes gene_type:complete
MAIIKLGINSGAGKVLQVVQTVKTDTFTTNSQTPVDVTGLSVAITPSSTSSKILISVNVFIGGASNRYPYLLLLRGSTSIGLGSGASGSRINTFISTHLADTYKMHGISNQFLDSPATTSATTYKIQLTQPYESGHNAHINRQDQTTDAVYTQFPSSNITVTEIAG